MKGWQNIEWPSPCAVCVLTRARLVEMDFPDEIRADYLFIAVPFNHDIEDEPFPVWVTSPERLREFVRMAAPERLEIKHADGEDVTGLREYCLTPAVY